MDVHGLHQYIRNTGLLSSEKVDEIKQLLEVYPYFQTLKLLYLKALSLHKSPDFRAELNRLAIDVADRKVLYTLLKGEKEDPYFSPASSSKPAKNSFDLIDAFLASDPQSEPASDKTSTLLLESSVSADYFQWSRLDTDKSEKESQSPAKEVKMKHQDLIDSFIEKDSMRDRTMPQYISEEEEMPKNEEIETDDNSIKSLDDTYFTETLARIYVKQKRYDKALQIIRNLYLKYPGKNIYFADQIRFLEKLIINTKKID